MRRNFNSHARVGRDTPTILIAQTLDHFNSHARVGRDTAAHLSAAACLYFNSHARVGRDFVGVLGEPSPNISTHTPV